MASDSRETAPCKRGSLPSVRLHGEAGSVDHAARAEGIKALGDALEGYDMPKTSSRSRKRASLTACYPDKRAVRGLKGMAAKERYTLHVCANAAGVEAPLVAVGVANEPPCFAWPFRYIHQNNSWSDTRTTQDWFTFSLGWLRSYTTDPTRPILHDKEVCPSDGQPTIGATGDSWNPASESRHSSFPQTALVCINPMDLRVTPPP